MALIYTVGPSGAGKDSVLAWLRQHLPLQTEFHFAQRCITRARTAEGEQHEPMDAASFSKALANEEFVFHWRANQLDYGIRHGELEGLQHARNVVVNGSRTHLQIALQMYPELIVLQITASPEILRERLVARARESTDAIEARMQRGSVMPALPAENVIEIHNERAIEDAGEQLLAALRDRGLLAQRAH